MPCSSDYPGEHEVRKHCLRKLSLVTRVACDLMRLYEAQCDAGAKIKSAPTKETKIWMREHKLLDDKRKKLEAMHEERRQLIRSAKAKLTKEERLALGITKRKSS